MPTPGRGVSRACAQRLGRSPGERHSGQAADDQDGIYLRENFNRIHTDPHVCELLQRHGIQYFYADKDIVFNGNRLSKFRPGLYEVDTSSGFTLVDSGGTASLWHIDICD